MKFFISIFLIFGLTNFKAFSQEKKLTLRQCIETAIANNISVKQTGLMADAAAVNLTQAKNNLLPNINGNIGYGLNQGRTVNPLTNSYINQRLTSSSPGISASVVLFNGMRLQNIIQQSNLTFEANKMDFKQAQDNLTLNVILAYLQVLNNQDVLAISKAQILTTKAQIDRMAVLVKEGTAANYQLTDLKGQNANESLAVVNGNNALQQSILNLCQLMNIDYNSELQLEKIDNPFPDSKYGNNAEEIYKLSLQNFASIKANDFKIKSAEKGIKISKAGYYPTLSLFGNIGSNSSSLAQTLTPTNITQVTTGDYVLQSGSQIPVYTQHQNYSAAKTGLFKQLDNNLGTFIGLNVQIPIFNGFQTKNKIKTAEINWHAAKLQADNDKLILKQNIEQAFLNMNAAYDKYKILLEQVTDFEESFRAAEVRFTNGVINTPEYLIAKNNYDNAKINLTVAKYEYGFRVEVLDFYKGERK